MVTALDMRLFASDSCARRLRPATPVTAISVLRIAKTWIAAAFPTSSGVSAIARCRVPARSADKLVSSTASESLEGACQDAVPSSADA